MNKSVLILGATSPIARAVASSLAAKGHPLFLAARDEAELARLGQDFRIRFGVEVRTGCFDADNCGGHGMFVQHVVKQMGNLEGIVLAFGYVGNHGRALQDFSETEKIVLRNFTGACSILSSCSNYLEKQGYGFIVGISSTASDRGRYSNYIFGASRAGLTVFLQGLRNRLYHSGVHVLTVKPGWVDSPSTFASGRRFAITSPDEIGRKVVQALQRGRNEVYIPWYWRGIMTAIKSIPECFFKRLKL